MAEFTITQRGARSLATATCHSPQNPGVRPANGVQGEPGAAQLGAEDCRPVFCATSVCSTGLDWSEGNCFRCSKGSRVCRVCLKHVILWKLPSLSLECL